MSARQPFVPQAKQAGSVVDSYSDSFKTDTSMSSECDANRSSATSLSLHSGTSDESSLSINKPLNIGNLMKNKNLSSASASPFQPQTRRSFEDEIPRPFSPSANAKSFKPSARGRKIGNSSPFFPAATHYQPMAGFRTPLVPSPTKRHSAASIEDLNINDPHTPISAELLGPENEIQHAQRAVVSGRHRLSRSGPHVIGEQPKHAQDINEDSLNNNIDGADNSDHDEANNDPVQYYDSAYNEPGSSNNENYTRVPLRRVQKRAKQADEIGIDLDYNTAKRCKLGDGQELQSKFAPHCGAPDAYRSSPQRTPSPVVSAYVPSTGPSLAPTPGRRKDHVLFDLFGKDLDDCVDARIDAYEKAKKKWTTCSIEEWKAGADELAVKFGGLLDFVKEHMNTKLALYATFDTALGSHRKVLADREQTLQEVRDTLIQNGGNVCGVRTGEGKVGGTLKNAGLSNESK